jgi:hypothetical protein
MPEHRPFQRRQSAMPDINITGKSNLEKRIALPLRHDEDPVVMSPSLSPDQVVHGLGVFQHNRVCRSSTGMRAPRNLLIYFASQLKNMILTYVTAIS